ncbi:MAG: ABC transporter ATP-binding protein [Desulfobacterales bacterium]|nr:ABC transporter ATP-binding protein [Desulfobacterales bacterium]
MSPVLEVDKLSLGYPGKTILSGVCFDVRPGEVVSIIGPNGTGKTTLVKAISGHLPPMDGAIRIKGKAITALSPRERASHLAVVMQNLEPVSMGVEEYILLGRLPFFKKFQFFETRQDQDLAREYMALTHMDHLAKTSMDKISGGERQLAAMARALTQEPSLLVLDEPTSHLDITHQVRILDLVRQLTKKLSLAALMVIHDMNLAAEYSDRLVLLNKDRQTLEAVGTPEAVLTEAAMEKVYHVKVKVQDHPVSGKPAVFPVSGSRG